MQETVEENTSAEVPLFSVVDIIILVAIIGVGTYWILLRKKKSEANNTSFKAYTMQPTLQRQQTETSFVSKLKSSGRSLVVFYGSQTGTAEEFAGRLAKEGVRYRMKGMVADPEECEMEELTNLKDIPNSLAIFCMATYGEGDPTDNAAEFYEWLQSGDCDLSGLNYAVFGLGNKTYEHYNETAKYVDKRLAELGANRVFELGLGDDDSNIEEDFITWKDRFWPAVCDHFNIEDITDDINSRQYRLVLHEEIPKEKLFSGEIARLNSLVNQKPPYDQKNPFMSAIHVNRELHKGGDRSCMHIELNIEGSRLRYEAGDHVAIYPINDTAAVNSIGSLLGVDLDVAFSLINTDEDSTKKHPFPCPTTYRTALSHYLDITSPPRTHILKELADHTSHLKDKEHLLKLCSPSVEGKEMYTNWILNARRGIVSILEDLKSCKPPLDLLCELMPRLQPRYYSISSSPKVHPTRIHVTAVLVEYPSSSGRTNKGVATAWLSKKKPDENQNVFPQVPVFVRKSQFRLPAQSSSAVIMVGPGTGLAPFRGFIQERAAMKDDGKPVGETVLFFGCRKKVEDFIYDEELKQFEESGLLKLHLAFSRDQAHKVYVTHLLQQESAEIWRLLNEKNGHLYVCGDARNMARDVHEIMTKIIEKEGNMSTAEATAYVKKMEGKRRYQADVWS